VLDVYLYIVVFPLVRGFLAYLHTCTCTIYVAFGLRRILCSIFLTVVTSVICLWLQR
jgi:hypothetical protein